MLLKMSFYKKFTVFKCLKKKKRKVLEKVKFPNSLLGKAWEKRRTSIESLGQEQVEATGGHGKQLVKSNAFSAKEKSIQLNNQKEIFYNVVVEKGTGEIEKLHNIVNFQNLIDHFKDPTKVLILMILLISSRSLE